MSKCNFCTFIIPYPIKQNAKYLRHNLWRNLFLLPLKLRQKPALLLASLINEGLLPHGTEGRIRGVPVSIGGTSYIPPLPFESVIKENLSDILTCDQSAEDKAIRLCLYCMKTQVFLDGNKRAAVIFANHYLISHGGGLLIIPEASVSEFKKLLILYYEDRDSGEIMRFFKDNCILRLN